MSKQFRPVNASKRLWMEEIRKEMNLTIREIAPLIGGISWNHYADIEAGRRNPSIELSYKLAEFFKVDVEWFWAERTKFKAKGE
jgi:DNA-binding XRE family transcriptional regulator